MINDHRYSGGFLWKKPQINRFEKQIKRSICGINILYKILICKSVANSFTADQ